ncbi:MAG: sigma-70 family RNA polymerase sigma factor [Pirellulaceae bacterium]
MTQVATRLRARTKKRGRATRSEIMRRAERILRTEPHYVYDACFDAPDAAAEILAAPEEPIHHRRQTRATKDADFYVAFLYQTNLLSRAQETYLFRKMNYLKFLAYRRRQGLDPATATLAHVDAIESLEEQAVQIRNHIIESNLRLVTARAKQFARSSGLPLDELISEGNIGLVQAVEHFDFSRGTKLSTYATWAIINKLLAYLQRSKRESRHFTREHGVPLDGMEGDWLHVESVLSQSEIREKLGGMLKHLKERERIAVENRFGFVKDHQPKTLKDLATQWGVTKQRAQQVCAGAVNKLRGMVEQAGIGPWEA